MTNTGFVVLGGTGAVGRAVASHLLELGHDVTISSRNSERAARTAAELPGSRTHVMDLTGRNPLGDLEPPAVVIDCTGIESVALTQRLLGDGFDVVDITADARHTVALLALEPTDTALVVGVGLMPGFSTLLGERLHGHTPGCSAITLSALIGLGDTYGNASKRWTYSQLGRPLTDRPDIRGFTQSEIIEFPGWFGRRRAWQVDFADRLLLNRRLGLPITTRYCFDSRLAGAALSIAARVPRAAQFLRQHPDLTRPPRHASDWYAFVAEADTGTRIAGIGRAQADSTAVMVALAADRLAATRPTGLLTTPDLLDLDEVLSHPDLELLAIERT